MRLVAPEAKSVTCWGISEWGKDADELFVGNDAGLGEAVHAAADFTQDVAVVRKSGIRKIGFLIS